MSDTVWLLEFEANGPEAGDYSGYTSIHTTRDKALNRLHDRFYDLGFDRGEDVQVIDRTEASHGEWADLEVEGRKISYGVTRMAVED